MKILIVYHSRLGSVQKMARLISRGVESVENTNALVRTVPEVATKPGELELPDSGDALVSMDDLIGCDGLIIGSPTRFGNMSAAMKFFLDSTTNVWVNGHLVGKPAAVFTSSSSMHGGQESTCLSMLNPLLHHGMVICGLPYTEPALGKTITGGTPYGASHVAGSNNAMPISNDEKALCLALGKRVAMIAQKLSR